MIGLDFSQDDPLADLEQALKLRLVIQQAELEKLVPEVSITEAGVLENRHLYASVEDSARWHTGQKEANIRRLNREYPLLVSEQLLDSYRLLTHIPLYKENI